MNINPNQIDNSEIDLVELIKHIYKKKILIGIITLLAIGLSTFIFVITPPEYQVTSSFFVDSNTKNNSSFDGYASLLGVSSQSSFDNLIASILESKSIKINISRKYIHYYQNDILNAIAKQKIKPENKELFMEEFVIKKLNLNTNFSYSIDKKGLFKLYYHSKDRQLATSILNHYLKEIIQFNETFEFSSEKNFITIIDMPQIPLNPFKPKLKIILLIGFISGFSISLLYTFIEYAIIQLKNRTAFETK
jgi:uncharacterized protein involved in exopolysaccharide biosynthesis